MVKNLYVCICLWNAGIILILIHYYIFIKSQYDDSLFTELFWMPQVNNTQLIRKDRELWNITTKALLHLGVILVVDIFFHYLYILTIPSDMKLVTKLSDWCLGELIMFPQCFHVSLAPCIT